MADPVFQLETHFGDEAAREYRAAMRSMHAFAQRTKCPLGVDVIQWFWNKHQEFDEVVRANRANPHQQEDKPNV